MRKEDHSYLKTYRYQVIRIIISIISLIIISSFTSKYEEKGIGYMLGWFMAWFAVYQIVIGLSYIGILYERGKKKVKRDTSAMKYHEFSVERIIGILADEDVFEIDVIGPETLISIGVSSENKYIGSPQINRMYFIDDCLYKDVIDFEKELRRLWPEGVLKVHKIIDLDPEDTSYVDES